MKLSKAADIYNDYHKNHLSQQLTTSTGEK